MTIIEKIKAEIERLKKAQEVSEDYDYAQYELDVACGYDMACDDILSFLSTLEPEKSTIEDVEETLKINEKMKSREQNFSSRSAMSREATRNFHMVSTSTDKP